jgi:hypothetical protein
LVPGSEGVDVKALEDELVRLGKPAKADSFLSGVEMKMIGEIAKSAGVEVDDALTRDLVVWLPTGSATVDTCEKQLGASVSPGDIISQVDAGIVLSSVKLPDDRLPGTRLLELLQEPITLGDSGELPPGLSSSDIRNSDAFREAASGAPDASTLTLKGKVKLKEPVQVAAVPATAVLIDSQGAACVFTGKRATPVTIVGSEFGSSFVAFESEEAPESVDVLKPGRQTSCK